MKIARPVPIEPIIEALEQARAAGATHLTFLGGEPTLHKRFLEAVAKAVELGFSHIVIFTNGVMFPHPGFIDSVTALGKFEWRISIQGATDEAHVAVTERPDSFRRILHGLGELQRRGQLVTTNMCVNERSYRSLPHYPELIAKYGVRQLHVDIVRPESTGERDEIYLRDIMPRYSDMAPYYAQMLDGFERWDPSFDVNVGNLPHCVLPEWALRIHHGGQQTVTKSSDGAGLEEEMNKYEWQTSLRTHLPTCEPCVFRSRCTGIFRGYLELHGGDEFRPVSYEQLRELDPERKNFVVLAEPLLRGLRAAIAGGSLPGPWRLRQEVSEDRLRSVEILLEHAQGGGLRLRFVAPGKAREPVLRGVDYHMDAEADLNVPVDALSQVLAWVAEQLRPSVDATVAADLMEDAVDLALRASVMGRGRQRVAVLASKLQSHFAIPGWRLEPLRWSNDATGELVAKGPGHRRVALRFLLTTRANRSQVGVDFGANAENGDDQVKGVITQLVQLLRTKPTAASSATAASATY